MIGWVKIKENKDRKRNQKLKGLERKLKLMQKGQSLSEKIKLMEKIKLKNDIGNI